MKDVGRPLSDSTSLDGKRVVIAGAAGLIGSAISIEVAQRGAQVILSDIDRSAADELARSIGSAGGDCWSAHLDVQDPSSIAALIDSIEARSGGATDFVNCSYPKGANFGARFEDVTYEDFCATTSAHLGGYFLASQRFAEYFRSGRGGSITNFASIYGIHAPRFEVYDETPMTVAIEYVAAKAGIVHMTRYMARYYLKDGVRCNVIAPGGVRDHQPTQFLERYDSMCGKIGMLAATDLSGVTAFLLSPAARAMTGQVLVVDDGWSL